MQGKTPLLEENPKNIFSSFRTKSNETTEALEQDKDLLQSTKSASQDNPSNQLIINNS